MTSLREYILQFGALTIGQTNFIESKAQDFTLRKGEYFSQAGKVPGKVAFLIDGILRSSNYDDRGEEMTTFFINGIQLVVDYEAFEAIQPASENVQAVTDCKLLVFSREDWEELTTSIFGWDKIADKMYRKYLTDTIRKKGALISLDATTRYLLFLEKFPAVANRVPLSYIASYLGITQQSFSRIRKNIQ